MGIADKNLRHAALAGKLLHFGKNFRIIVMNIGILEEIMQTVTVYTGPYCPYCTMAKRLLQAVGVKEINEINVHDYMGISVILQVFPPYGCKKHSDGLLAINICADAEKPFPESMGIPDFE
jgi:hypothetical protein